MQLDPVIELMKEHEDGGGNLTLLLGITSLSVFSQLLMDSEFGKIQYWVYWVALFAISSHDIWD